MEDLRQQFVTSSSSVASSASATPVKRKLIRNIWNEDHKKLRKDSESEVSTQTIVVPKSEVAGVELMGNFSVLIF